MHQTSANPIHQTSRKCECFTSIFVEMRDTVCLVPCANISWYHLRSFLFGNAETFLAKRPKSSTSLCGSYCSQNSLVLLSEFSASLSVLPRSFFFFLSQHSKNAKLHFFFFCERKGKKWASIIHKEIKVKLIISVNATVA